MYCLGKEKKLSKRRFQSTLNHKILYDWSKIIALKNMGHIYVSKFDCKHHREA
jgi:hypothetical protein